MALEDFPSIFQAVNGSPKKMISLHTTFRTLTVLFVIIFALTSVSIAASTRENEKGKAPKRQEVKARNASRESTAKSSVGKKQISKTLKNERAEARGRLKSAAAKSESKRKQNSRDRETASKVSASQPTAKRKQSEPKRSTEPVKQVAVTSERTKSEELRDRVRSMIEKDDLTGEDPEIRRVALQALGSHAGTIVVMNPQTGRIYSIVNQQWALQEGFKPCSTIKLVTGLAGLNESVIDPTDTTKISTTNQTSLTKALAYSRNGYFQQVGEQVGFEKMLSYARTLGLGEKTGINARNEFKGRLPGAQSASSILRMSSHGDHFEVTPLQLATLVAAIGNGGKLLKPYIVRTRQDETKFKKRIRRNVDINAEAWQHLIPGMRGAVNYGTARVAHDSSLPIAGKTGTCIEQGRWVGLFTSYAPVTNPKLAVVVITRGQDARAHVPAAVAGAIYRELGGRFGEPREARVAARRNVFAQKDDVIEMNDEEEASALEDMKPRIMERATPKTSIPSVDVVPVVGDGQTRPRRVSIGG